MTNQFGGFAEVTLPQIWHTQNSTFSFLKENNLQTLEQIAIVYSGYRVLLALPTGFRFPNRSYYPYNLPFYEGLEELDSSLVLAFSGQYKSAIQHLRFFLELAFLGLYMFTPMSEHWVQNWLLGETKTPAIGEILKTIEKNSRAQSFRSLTGVNLRNECYAVYNELSGYVHTRGYYTLGTSIRGSNFPILNQGALETWVSLLSAVVRIIALGMILSFPQALQRLPLYNKFGFAKVPRGGFLEPFEVKYVERMFETELVARLKQFSDLHYSEMLSIDWNGLEKAPNLSLEELKSSLEEWWEIMKLADHGDIPDKTWYVDFLGPEVSDASRQLGNAKTSEEYVEGATIFVRQMSAGDEAILAQAYTINLLKGKGLPIYKTRTKQG